MQNRTVLVFTALGCFFLWGCSSEAPSASGSVAPDQPTTSPQQAGIDQLVLINRMLTSEEFGVLGAYGHVSVRSQSDPNRFLISRAVSPGLVTASDIYESDLDGNPVAGNRSDLLEERFIHSEIYKARPDITSVVYTNTPELVAYSVSSVPLSSNDRQMPIFDIRKIEGGQIALIDTPDLGRALAEFLARGNATLIFGHGAVVASSSPNDAVRGSLSLRQAAVEGLFARSLGGTLTHGVVTREGQAAAAADLPGSGVERVDRRAIFHNYLGARDLARIPNPARSTPADSDQAIIEDLVIANRLMAGLGIITTDGSGHISARSRSNPNRFFIPADVSPGIVTASDIIEVDLDTKPVEDIKVPQYSERFIHSEIYRAKPEIMSVIHSHTPEFRVFGQSSVKLRPVLNHALFIGDGLPIFDIRKYNGGLRDFRITNPEHGRILAQTMGDKPAALLLDHGIALGAESVRALVSRAYNLRMNARVQQMAILLGGAVNFFQPARATKPAQSASGTAVYPEWDYWKEFILASTDLNSVPKPGAGLPVGLNTNQ